MKQSFQQHLILKTLSKNVYARILLIVSHGDPAECFHTCGTQYNRFLYELQILMLKLKLIKEDMAFCETKANADRRTLLYIDDGHAAYGWYSKIKHVFFRFVPSRFFIFSKCKTA